MGRVMGRGESDSGKGASRSFRARALRYHRRRGLLKGTRHLVHVSVLTLLGRTGDLREALEWALERRVAVNRLKETILQTALFGGFPRAIHALETLDEVLSARGDVVAPETDRIPPRVPHRAFFRRRGRDLFREVYRDDTDAVVGRISGFHPEFMDWITEVAYGRVLARPVLDLKTREIIASALLTVLDLPRQLTPHLRGALRAGATFREVEEALRQLALVIPRRTVTRALVRLDRARTTL
ncbi:MAG: carboxymuconolactone decarboxylase family protein [Planctomycetota bacterium]